MTPAGWYVDPEGTGQLRWWDGTGWTHHRQSPTEVQLQQLQRQVQQMPMARTMIEPGDQIGRQMPLSPAAARSSFESIGTTIPNSESPPRSPLFVLVWLGLLGTAIGPFLNWFTVSISDFGGFTQSIKGTTSAEETWLIGSVPDGYIMLGIAALVLVASITFNGRDSASAAGWIATLGIIGLAWAAASFLGYMSKLDDFDLGSRTQLRPGVGLWVAGIGAALVVLGGLATKATAKRAGMETPLPF